MKQGNASTPPSIALAPPMPRLLLAGIAGSVATGILGGKLTTGPLKRSVRAFDRQLTDITHEVRNPVLDFGMTFSSKLGEPLMLYPLSGLVGIIWLAQKKGYESLSLGMALAGSAAINKVVKSSIQRPRPMIQVPFPRSRASGSSFPSNHAAMTLATYGAIAWLLVRRRRRDERGAKSKHSAILRAGLPLVICALIGWSRVYQGVHNPSDVIGGWLVGGIWLFACTYRREVAQGERP
jgi:undecaprenyl-diphosphatase